MSFVGITRSEYRDVDNNLPVAIERGGGLDIKEGDTVVIKINLCQFRMPETGAITHPIFLDSLLNYLRRRFKDIFIKVVESDASIARPDLFVKWLGFEPIFKKYGVEYINLTRDEKVLKKIDGRHFKKLKIPKTIVDADYFISTSKLKTCLLTKLTCTLKNQFGCLPSPNKFKYHKYLDDIIVDANLAMKPNFSIVDGIIAMGGVKGPDLGVPINANLIITGKDPVSTDSACAKIMGFNPRSVGHIRKAHSSGLGLMEFKIVSDKQYDYDKDFEFSRLYSWILNTVYSMRT